MTRDRTGEDIPDDDRRATGDHHCHRGWLTRPGSDESRPCLDCKPWLVDRRPPTGRELAEFARRHPARRRP